MNTSQEIVAQAAMDVKEATIDGKSTLIWDLSSVLFTACDNVRKLELLLRENKAHEICRSYYNSPAYYTRFADKYYSLYAMRVKRSMRPLSLWRLYNDDPTRFYKLSSVLFKAMKDQ